MARPIMSQELISKAQGLRAQGCSLSEISKALSIAKSTASLWSSNVRLDVNATAIIDGKVVESRRRSAELQRLRREQKIGIINVRSEEYVDSLDRSNRFDLLLCSLIYWCEGVKDNKLVTFMNSDPNLIRTFLRLFRSSFKIDESKFRVMLHLHNYHDEETQISFWGDVTGVDRSQFYKCYIKSNTGKRKRPGYQGCASVRYYDGDVAKMLLSVTSKYMTHEKNMGGAPGAGDSPKVTSKCSTHLPPAK